MYLIYKQTDTNTSAVGLDYTHGLKMWQFSGKRVVLLVEN